MSEYFGTWELTDKDRTLHALAQRYHTETEAFDRTVCTGPVRDGSIMPMDHRELAIINRNAAEVLKVLQAEAAIGGITREELWRAIGRHA
jgi:hypothetical protein